MKDLVRDALVNTSLLVLICALSGLSAATARAADVWHYTALGDSLAFGILDLSGGGYVPRYGAYLQVDNNVAVRLNNLGRNGWTSAQLLAALHTDAAMRSAVASSQVVTWDIGGNDFLRASTKYQDQNTYNACGGADNQDCFRSTVTEFKRNWDGIISEILSLRGASNKIIRTMDIYNPFVGPGGASDSWSGDGGVNDLQALKPYIDEVNRHIQATAAANNIPCAKVSLAFNGATGLEDPSAKGYLTIDGVHPSDLGHHVIAGLFRALLYDPLAGGQTPQPAAPILMTESGSTPARAIALDSVTFARDPFPLMTDHNFSPDGRTRVVLFAENVEVGTVDPLSAISAQVEDARHTIYPLVVEFAARVPGAQRFTQINCRLPDELGEAAAGDLLISISVNGAMSNKAFITVGP